MIANTSTSERGDAVAPRLVPRRHPGRWLTAAVIAAALIYVAISVARNPGFHWDVVGEYLFSSQILSGLQTTILLTIVAMVIAVIVGTIIAIMRLSANPVLAGISWTYAWLLRAIPTLVLLILIYNISALYPRITFGLPFGLVFFSADANEVITPLVAAILGLSLSESAYMSEIIRSGILAVDRGQTEAAWAIGMSRRQTIFRIVLPQALRVIIPPTGNQFIGMLKFTSLVSVLALSDLLYSAQRIYQRIFNPIPLLVVATLWYIAIVSLLMVGQYYLEKRMGRGYRGALSDIGSQG